MHIPHELPAKRTLRDWLRSATTARHREVEAIAARRASFEKLSGYAAWLTGMQTVHRHFEQVWATTSPGACLPAASFHRRAELLALDLRDVPPVTCAMPRPAGPVPTDDAERLGVLYVTEGASLGARVLLVRARALGLDATRGARFLSAQAQHYTAWRELVDRLNGASLSREEEQRLLDMSLRTFAYVAACLGEDP
jgi:heme oxygenase